MVISDLPPRANTASNGASSAAISLARVGRLPLQSGCAVGNGRCAGQDEPYTGAPSASARATVCAVAPLVQTSSPAMIASRPGAASASSPARRSSDPATGWMSMVDGRPVSTDVTSSIMSIGSDRNTGPEGAASQSCSARRSRTGNWSALVTSRAHLTLGVAMLTRSPNSSGSIRACRESCWPAVTTSGVPATWALSRLPMPCPSPPAVCRLTKPGRPAAWA